MVFEIFRLISPFISLACNLSVSLRAMVILAYNLDSGHYFLRRLVGFQSEPNYVFSCTHHPPDDNDDTNDPFTHLPNSRDSDTAQILS
jgi:hypothetical protein